MVETLGVSSEPAYCVCKQLSSSLELGINDEQKLLFIIWAEISDQLT